jgi:hypothetical protein
MRRLIILGLVLIAVATWSAPARPQDGRYAYVTASASMPRRACYDQANCRLMAGMMARHLAYLKLVDRLKVLTGHIPEWSTRSIRFARVVQETATTGSSGGVQVTVTLKAPLGYMAWSSGR